MLLGLLGKEEAVRPTLRGRSTQKLQITIRAMGISLRFSGAHRGLNVPVMELISTYPYTEGPNRGALKP